MSLIAEVWSALKASRGAKAITDMALDPPEQATELRAARTSRSEHDPRVREQVETDQDRPAHHRRRDWPVKGVLRIVGEVQ